MSASSDLPYPDLGSAYEILEVLGEGGMGTVYLARDVRHERRVAVKTIRRDFVTPEVSQRFEREIRVTSRLQHPRILPLLDSGVADGALYYVMQFIEGESLEERLEREGPLPIEDALRIARHVADALAYAHDRNVVHRDIKPANVMLSEGHAFVMDFGIARAVAEGGTSLTSTGSAIGTPRYMSPEQVSDSTTVDGRSDIYSLGCVLYEMVAGQPPFVGPTVDSVLRQHLASEPPTLGVHRPGTPQGVDAIVTRALQKSPADRFQSARELTEELRELAIGGPELASPSSSLRTGAIVLIAYLFGAWGLIALVERVAVAAALPPWTVPFAIVLLLIGLLVTGATTVVQTWGRVGGTRSGGTDPGTTDPRGTGSSMSGAPRTRDRLRALLRWRNVFAGGVLALALWGLVAAFLIWRDRPAGNEGASRQLAAAPAGPAGDHRPTDGSTDDSGAVAEGEDVPSDPAARDTPPPPPPAPVEVTGDPPEAGAGRGAATAVDSAALVASARETAARARAEAARLGARSVPTPGMAGADSLWDRATEAAAEGRHTEAAEAFTSAREAYGDAGREARQFLVERMDSARAGTDSLRQRASPDHEAYAEGERHRAESRDLEVAGDRLGALAALDRASRAYIRAMPFVELPADYEAEADPAEALEVSPAERIESAMSALERAFEAEDVAAIQHVWVNLSPGQVEGFRGFFAESGDVDYQYALDPASVRVTDQGIEFEVAVRWEYEERGEVHTQSFDQRFRLEPTGNGDVLFSL